MCDTRAHAAEDTHTRTHAHTHAHTHEEACESAEHAPQGLANPLDHVLGGQLHRASISTEIGEGRVGKRAVRCEPGGRGAGEEGLQKGGGGRAEVLIGGGTLEESSMEHICFN